MPRGGQGIHHGLSVGQAGSHHGTISSVNLTGDHNNHSSQGSSGGERGTSAGKNSLSLHDRDRGTSARDRDREMIGGCCVCSDERGWDENPLVYCDGQGCNVAVHQGKLTYLHSFTQSISHYFSVANFPYL